MSEWIEHNGGPCPVPAGTMVDVKHRDGDIFCHLEALRELYARERSWRHEGMDGDIIAYRIHRPADVPFIPDVPVHATTQSMETIWEFYQKPTLRDQFAMAALNAIVSTAAAPCIVQGLQGAEMEAAKNAYILADAMLKAREVQS